MDPVTIMDVIATMSGLADHPGSDRILYIFGRNPELSWAELIACFHRQHHPWQITAVTPLGAEVSTSHPISLTLCGSVLKRAHFLGLLPDQAKETAPIEQIETVLRAKIFADPVLWALSTYYSPLGEWPPSISPKQSVRSPPRSPLPAPPRAIVADSETVLQEIKRAFKRIGIRKAQQVKSPDGNALEPRRIQQKGLLDNGIEFLLWITPSEASIWVTEEVIDIDGFDHRDQGRPHTRPLLQLGLALARTMINLISLQENRHDRPIYDPFCGMGSILAEAVMIGVSAVGSDIDPICINHCRKNLQWLLTRNRGVPRPIQSPYAPIPQLFVMDLRRPNPSFPFPFPGSIVTEPDLLTPLDHYPSDAELIDLLRSFEANYRDYLRGLAQILAPDAVCVMIFPRIHGRTHLRHSLPIPEMLTQAGFSLLPIHWGAGTLPAVFHHTWKAPIIEREIVVFQKTRVSREPNS